MSASNATSEVGITNLLLLAFLNAGGASVRRIDPPPAGSRKKIVRVDFGRFSGPGMAEKLRELAARVEDLPAAPSQDEIDGLYDWTVIRPVDEQLEQAKRAVAGRGRRER